MEADQRATDLLLWGVYVVRDEPCESCGAPMTLQEQTSCAGQLDGTVLRWYELVRIVAGDPRGYLLRDHDGDRCRELRRRRSLPPLPPLPGR